MTKGLFVFRRDLRVFDNKGLIEFSKLHDEISCVFILDPKQINPKVNKYFSASAFMFMLDSIQELRTQIGMSVLYGNPKDIIDKLIKKYKFDAVGFNEDYTPYAKLRDDAISAVKFKDICLNSPEEIKPYKVFTPYYLAAAQIKVDQPDKTNVTNVVKLKEKSVDIKKLKAKASELAKKQGSKLELLQPGGRTNGLKCLKAFKCSGYGKDRDMLTYETSRLGPHLKFGTISVREVYYACKDATFRKQLYWRDFYTQIGYHFPKVYGYNFKNQIKWENDKDKFDKWCKGETGFDIVDACMKQLNQSGYMHNRGRMIVASFLTKLLHIDWRWGEQYFATRLTDYDPANNNGGWQWSAGTGVDAQPYFRIFNPYTQADKFDPDGEYRKKWLGDREEMPEIIDYAKERERALKLIK